MAKVMMKQPRSSAIASPIRGTMATVMMKIFKDYRSTGESCEGSAYFWLVSSEGAERMHFCDTTRPFLFLLVMLFVVGQQLGIRFSFPIHRLG